MLDLTKGRQQIALLVACLIPFCVLVLLHWRVPPDISAGEYAQYLLHAQALLNGEPYTQTGYIYNPYNPAIGFPAQPPGLSVTLVPVVALAGLHSAVPKALMALSGVAFLLLAGWYFVRHEGPWVGAAVVLMTGVALEASYATNSVLPDLGFAALLWGLIALADDPRAPNLRRLLAITLLGFAAIAYRLPGVAIVPAMLLFAVLDTRPARLLFLVPVGIWIMTLLVIAATMNPAREMTARVPSDVGFLVRLFWTNVSQYPRLLLDAHLYPFPGNWPNDVYHLTTGGLTVVGLLTWARGHQRTFLGAFALLFAFLLLIAPVRSARYTWALYPLLVLGLVRGLEIVLGRVRAWRPLERRSAIVFSIIAMLSVLGAASIARRPRLATLVDHPDTVALFVALRAIRTTQPVRVMFTNPRVLALETGIASMAPFEATDETVVAELKRSRISHVITGDLGLQPELQAQVKQFIGRHPAAFHEVYKNASYTVWEYTPEARPGP